MAAQRKYNTGALFIFPLPADGTLDFVGDYTPAAGDAKIWSNTQISANPTALILGFDSLSELPADGAQIDENGAGTAEGIIEKTVIVSGTVGGGDAAGFFFMRSVTGQAWSNDDQIDINGGTANIATADSTTYDLAATAGLIGEIGNGLFAAALSPTEMSCALGEIHIVDSATKAIEDQAIQFETYGNASAQHAFDQDTARQDVSLTHIMGSILTEGAGGRLKAAFVKLFDVVTPALVASDVMVGTNGANTTTPNTVTPPTVAQMDARTLVAANYATATNLGTVLSRLSAVRAGFLDNLNVGGNVASQADVQGITVASKVRVVVPPLLERPDASSLNYRIWIYSYNETGTAEDLDSNPTVTVENNLATDRSGNLGTVTKQPATTGVYYVDYNLDSGDAVEGLVFKVAATEGAVETVFVTTAMVVDTTAVDFTAADRTKLDGIQSDLDNGTDGLGAIKVLIDAVNTDLSNGTDGLGALKAVIDAILLDTDVIGAAGAGLTAIPPSTVTLTLPGQVAPSLTPTESEAIAQLYKWARNRSTQTATERKHYAANGTTVDQKASVSDDGTTFDRGEIGTGP